ncbi:halovibrin HvnC [Pseudomonas sp. SWRI153]|uniref:Halovibrin HvnC n=1 Tax=Pseudomonas khorasanensis TaxID=2745508 RepID=A0A923EZU8_9PSED|nr:halovibrin HvnC [Pseudomonas khorasanensis]MBV4484810.1 halovibrin HvnC [Pseudomonas khorasanensis]
MHKLIASLLLTLLLGCSQTTIQPPDVIDVKGVQVLNGPAIAEQLTTLYDLKLPNCNNSDAQPAFLCSGVTLRVTVKDPANKYKVWDPSPQSVKSGGVSFSYLRQDANFSRLAWGNGNGYMLYPIFGAPADKEDLDYRCIYPYDAWTWTRSDTAVCVAHPTYPVQSQLCHNAGVTSAEQWYVVWKIPGGTPNQRQCGFDISDDRNQLAGPAFYQSIRARALAAVTGVNEHNEVLIKTWTSRNPNTFPIMAFFFIAGGSNAGLADAQYNQKDFYNSTSPKMVVPIIRLTPATTVAGKATFTYITADQVVTP